MASYQLAEEHLLSDIPAEASGIAWNWDQSTFFVVANFQGSVWEYTQDFQTLLRSIPLEGLDTDTEGVAYLGDGWLAISAETNYVYVARVAADSASISLAPEQTQVLQPCAAPPVVNAGLEAIAYRPPDEATPGRFFVGQECQPMRVLQYDDAARTPPFEPASYANGTLVVSEPWDAEVALGGTVSDIAGMTYDTANDTLLLLSQASSRILRVEPTQGTLIEELPLAGTSSAEGVALYGSCRLAVMSEPNRVQVYAPP
ncbi:SdiA-regulated domain-containing protein [Myxococcota bacterium]